MSANPSFERISREKPRRPLTSSLGVTLLTITLDLIYTSLMPIPAATTEYMKLSVSERIQLVEDIWDSIAAEAPDTIELSQAQKAELHRRVAEHRTDPTTAVPWELVRSKLFSSKP
jgi:putative addiction module component (TIGR02574 family)